ncbi:hypothetical protein HPB50_010378 [Hyalomma asiaticum]|uniref:Uncharacterized protein n=1 Tax=Hyalomma asiaticum TaxID=266040 RepID=A0ACB7TIA9_HYAAI|nr:hypothetical protein HPB50_010378 [Hyalomma asiaticum]
MVAVDRLTLELVDVSREISRYKSASPARPLADEVLQPMEMVTPEEAHECPAPKKRSLNHSNQWQFKAKSEIEEALSVISDSIRQIDDRLTRIECSKGEMGIRLQKIETYLIETVVSVIDKMCPKTLATLDRSPSNSKLNQVSPGSRDGAGK